MAFSNLTKVICGLTVTAVIILVILACVFLLVVKEQGYTDSDDGGDWCNPGCDVGNQPCNKVHCTRGCCGQHDEEYCCPKLNVAGIVIGCIAGTLAIVSLLVCVCCCVRSQRMPGQILTPGRQNTTVTSRTRRYPVTTPTSPGVYGRPRAQQTAGMHGRPFVHQTGYTHGQNHNFASRPSANPATFQPPPSYEEVAGQKQELK